MAQNFQQIPSYGRITSRRRRRHLLAYQEEEISPTSSFTNLSPTHNDDMNDHYSGRSLGKPGQRKRGFVAFQGDDTSLLSPISPNNTEIKSYSDLFHHLQQSMYIVVRSISGAISYDPFRMSNIDLYSK